MFCIKFQWEKEAKYEYGDFLLVASSSIQRVPMIIRGRIVAVLLLYFVCLLKVLNWSIFVGFVPAVAGPAVAEVQDEKSHNGSSLLLCLDNIVVVHKNRLMDIVGWDSQAQEKKIENYRSEAGIQES